MGLDASTLENEGATDAVLSPSGLNPRAKQALRGGGSSSSADGGGDASPSNLMMNLPNFLTIVRILLIPFLIVIYYQGSLQAHILAAAFFLIASLTDVLDGYLARRRSEVTQFGKFLDPVADKLLIISALFLLVGNGRVSAWIAIILVGREFAVTGFRAIASTEGVVIAAEGAGKYKMFFQIVAITFLIVDLSEAYFHAIGLVFLWISLFLSLVSGARYFVKFGKVVNLQKVK